MRQEAQCQHGIEGVIEVGLSIVFGEHAASGIEQEHHLLVALFLIFAGDRFLLARRRLPVNGAHAVTVAIFTQLTEIGSFTTPTLADRTRSRRAPIRGGKGVAQ